MKQASKQKWNDKNGLISFFVCFSRLDLMSLYKEDAEEEWNKGEDEEMKSQMNWVSISSKKKVSYIGSQSDVKGNGS